jgi:hypothetical protein
MVKTESTKHQEWTGSVEIQEVDPTIHNHIRVRQVAVLWSRRRQNALARMLIEKNK